MEIALALKSYGHVVFFDKESLPPATDFRKQIERAIRASDRFIFLASRSALTEGRYTRTELGLRKNGGLRHKVMFIQSLSIRTCPRRHYRHI